MFNFSLQQSFTPAHSYIESSWVQMELNFKQKEIIWFWRYGAVNVNTAKGNKNYFIS